MEQLWWRDIGPKYQQDQMQSEVKFKGISAHDIQWLIIATHEHFKGQIAFATNLIMDKCTQVNQ